MAIELKHIEVKLARATTLPILPNAVSQLLAMSKDPNVSARDYERVITQDAALTTKILRAANSAYFGGGGNITTLQRAMAQIGFNAIKSIAITVAFQAAVMVKGLDPRFNVNHFWQHSLGVACASKVLACLKRHPLSEEAFVAGLMHDIGKLALCMFMPLEAGRVYSIMSAQQCSQYEAEEQFMGLTHQDVGLLAARRWCLPEMYHGPISLHHTPTYGLMAIEEMDMLTAFVHMGNALAYEADLGFAPAGIANTVDPIVADFLGIAEQQYEPLRLAVKHEVEKMSKQMGM